MPYDTAVHLWHDQTEATDGNRSEQREGWPASKDGKNPQPRWKELQRNAKEKSDKNLNREHRNNANDIRGASSKNGKLEAMNG
ncbi:MAG: hypothetical protein AAGJ18_15480 [Bacteroidota bacterium]